MFMSNSNNPKMRVVPRFKTINGKLDIKHVNKSDIENYSPGSILMNSVAIQYNLNDKYTKYVIINPETIGGWAQLHQDDKPTIDNINNYSGLAVVGLITYDGVAHEILHMLGAVQWTAPHSTGYGHCFDGSDIMCYQDSETGPSMLYPCAGNYIIDCNNDDYFSLKPQGYLSNHWNVAGSMYMIQIPVNYTYYFPFFEQYN